MGVVCVIPFPNEMYFGVSGVGKFTAHRVRDLLVCCFMTKGQE